MVAHGNCDHHTAISGSETLLKHFEGGPHNQGFLTAAMGILGQRLTIDTDKTALLSTKASRPLSETVLMLEVPPPKGFDWFATE